MTTTIKRFITVILTVATFAAMTTTAFAGIVPGCPGYFAGGTKNHIVGGYAEKYIWDTCFAAASRYELGNAHNASLGHLGDFSDTRTTHGSNKYTADALTMSQLIYHAIHAEECGFDCSGAVCYVSEKYHANRYTPVHFANVLKQADAIEAEFGDEITRAEAAMIIYRAAKEAGFTGKPELEDEDHRLIIDDLNDAPEEYREAIQFVMNNGLMEYPYSEKLVRIDGRHASAVPEPYVGFKPNTLLNGDEAMAASMYLHYTLNGVDINARKMYYTVENAKKVDALVRQASEEQSAGLFK